MSNIYYCTQENNTCLKKNNCKRYVEADNKPNATLYKVACTEDNNYILFIKAETEKEIGE